MMHDITTVFELQSRSTSFRAFFPTFDFDAIILPSTYENKSVTSIRSTRRAKLESTFDLSLNNVIVSGNRSEVTFALVCISLR